MLKRPSEMPPAEAIGAKALSFLAGDMERLGRFLALSGLQPRTIRDAARDTSFLPAVLDYVLADERLLFDFVEAEGLPPEAVSRARRELGPREPLVD